MEIINIKIPADLCRASIEEGLKELNIKRPYKIKLLISDSYSFHDIYSLGDNKNSLLEIPFKNIDTTNTLTTDAWMLIDNENKKIFYSPGS